MIYQAGPYENENLLGWHSRAGGTYRFDDSCIEAEGWFSSLHEAIEFFENPGKASVAQVATAPYTAPVQTVAVPVAPLPAAVPTPPWEAISKQCPKEVVLPWAKD